MQVAWPDSLSIEPINREICEAPDGGSYDQANGPVVLRPP